MSLNSGLETSSVQRLFHYCLSLYQAVLKLGISELGLNQIVMFVIEENLAFIISQNLAIVTLSVQTFDITTNV